MHHKMSLQMVTVLLMNNRHMHSTDKYLVNLKFPCDVCLFILGIIIS